MIISCPVCGWVKPLGPFTEMRSCPCGWNLLDDELHHFQQLAWPVASVAVTAATVAA